MGVLENIGQKAKASGITRGAVLGYLFMPQVCPRFAALFAQGFVRLPYYIALLYRMVGLLPPQHPYVQMHNMGRFGLRHVVAQAADHLILDWKHADQIALFCAILAGIVLIGVQIVLLPLSFAMAIAPAGAFGIGDLETPNPEQDIAFIMLDLVFGVPGIFESCVSTGASCVNQHGETLLTGFSGFPHPIHYGLHYLLGFYSWGLVVIAVFITCYFVTAVVVETAQTGTPMGKRFNHSWAVLRMVVAIGLLIPGGYGLNSGQYVVLYAAKFGSGLATNGWHLFLDELTNSNLGQRLDLIGKPNIPEIDNILQFYHVAATCKEAYATMGQDIRPYLVQGSLNNPPNLEVTASTTYQQMLEFAQGGNLVFVRFGTPDKEKNVFWKGYVRPTCGEIAFTLTDARSPSDTVNPPDRGPATMQIGYWNMVYDMWAEQSKAPNYPKQTVQKHIRSAPEYDPSKQPLPQARREELLKKYKQWARNALDLSVAAELNEAAGWGITQDFRDKGWAFAGVLYDYIAEKGGPIATAVYGVFVPSHYPEVMERICKQRRALDQKVPQNLECFNPNATAEGGSHEAVKITTTEKENAWAMYYAAKAWEGSASARTGRSSDGVAEFVHMIFGTDGLFNMRENANVHPLAQLTMVGRSLVESAARNIGYALVGGGAVAGALNAAFGIGGSLGSIAGFLLTIATVALSIGFLLFYIMPFLPFIYFFFGLGGWVKAIFEAMVGTPLWALAHIRIDGEGLTGDAAKSGYFLILEIFLRPILLIFGLLAGMSIFTAMVMSLNAGFDVAVVNLTGFSGVNELGDPGFTDVRFYRSYVDELFFTVIYAVVVYMIAMSSFKLIDLIPDQILRWMGVSVSPHSDKDENAAETMMQSASVGGQQAISSVGGGMQSLVGKVSGSGK